MRLRGCYQFLPLACCLTVASCTTVQDGGPTGRSAFESLIATQRDKAVALAAQGDLRGASEAWKVALTIDPKDAVALAESKNLDERIQQAIADRMARGREALKRNVHLEARGHFLAVLAMNPGHKEAFDALQTQVREVRQLNHTVRAGESLASIAQLYYGDRVRSEVIWETNQLPANPKLTPGMVLKIPEIPGLPFGRQDTPQPGKAAPSVAPTVGSKPEASEGELYANPALADAKEASERGDYVLALTTIDRFLGQNPRSSDAAELKRSVLFQQGKSLFDQNKLVDAMNALNQLLKLSPKDSNAAALMTNVRGRLVLEHYNQGIRLFRDEKLESAIGEWRSVLRYDPGHEGAKRNIEQAERLLKGLQQRQQKQGAK
jgi:tetratricopeptide (TPR) repeat protein